MTRTTRYNWRKLVPLWNDLCDRGFSNGLGKREGRMCVEAAVCALLNEPHGDEPSCVSLAVRRFKILLNDSQRWKSPTSRADGLRKLGLAQIGSKGVVDDKEFTMRLAEKLIRRLIPTLFREVLPNNAECLAAADRCEQEGTEESAREARKVAVDAAAYAAAAAAAAADAAAAAAYAVDAAAYAAYAAAAYAADAADAAAAYAAYAADAAAAAAAAAAAKRTSDPEKYLRLAADLALEVLVELKSPGVDALKYLEVR